jgi:hypothetical protein
VGLLRDHAIIASLVTASGVVLAALIERLGRRMDALDEKVEGLANGTYREALNEIEKLLRSRTVTELEGVNPKKQPK